MIDAILAVLREQKYENSPTVKELKKFDGLKDINAELKDQAWAKYQEELNTGDADTRSDDQNSGDTEDADTTLPDNLAVIQAFQQQDDAPAEAAKAQAQQTATTDTTATTEADEQAAIGPTHSVTVKTDGFRRLGRAWAGTTQVTLSDDEVAVLEADPMFSVTEL